MPYSAKRRMPYNPQRWVLFSAKRWVGCRGMGGKTATTHVAQSKNWTVTTN
jgi:hypothetical protein